MNGCGVKFYYKNKEVVNMNNYSIFDNDENIEIFYKLYEKEISNINNTYTLNIQKCELKDFKKTLNKCKVYYYISNNNNEYWYNLNIIYNQIPKNLFKYIQAYASFFDFNKHFENYQNVSMGNFYTYYPNGIKEDYFVFYTLDYNVGYFAKFEWLNHIKEVKETIDFIDKNELRCSIKIDNTKKDLKILQSIYEDYNLDIFQDNIESVDDINTFMKELRKKVDELNNNELSFYTFSSIKYNNQYIDKIITFQIEENIKIKNSIKKLENDKYKIIETMGIFLAIFSIININLGGITKESAIFSTISIIISMIVLFGLINIKNIIQLFKNKDNKEVD